MKKYLIILILILPAFGILQGQVKKNALLSNCLTGTDPDSKYLKDYIIELGQGEPQDEFRYKVKISLRRNTRYRFTLCTADNSKGKLILSIWDEKNKSVLSSFNQESGTLSSYVDFLCTKSGVYQVGFDFTGGQSGSGVSIVSKIR
jgi:hypothetical protein